MLLVGLLVAMEFGELVFIVKSCKDKNNNLIWDVTTSTAGSGPTGPTATGDGDAVGTIKPWAGASAPNQYMFTYGQALNRITYAPLFQAITSATKGYLQFRKSDFSRVRRYQ